MTDWEEVKRLFHEAIRDRRALEGASGDVRAEVEALLRAHEAAPAEAERPGSVIGRYKLLQQIGEGGFGVVYMAEQTAPVRRKVALKVLKAGMDTGQVVARFEAERQALALMDHANIAKVLDAGATAAGRPYFVMELVKGVPITQYCDEAQLDTRGRLGLFVHVCAAVQHAHQKGIIHRDLKPSNVLVTLHDGVPVPKIIDFGIAKALDRKLTDKTLFTEFRQMIGTPDYMAPEQAELSGLDVDTRADIYSLGVLLYELLTGTKPFDLGRKGYEEIVRTIRESEPQRPSTRVSTMGEEVRAVALKRHTPPAILGRVLRGDLDWIVLKALEKDRSRRYETANGLALDVQRYLADEPVLATPPAAAYRLRKYVRRHRVGVAAVAVVLGTLVASGAAAFAGMRQATVDAREARRAAADALGRRDEARAAQAREAEQRARAEAGAAEARKETARAEAVRGFVERMVSSADPHAAKGLNYTLRQMLDDFDRGLGQELLEVPAAEATIRLTMGRAYLGLGLTGRAEPHLRAVLERSRAVSGEESEAFAEALAQFAWVHHDRADYRAAERELRAALAIQRRLFGDEDRRVAASLTHLGHMVLQLARYEEAGNLCEEALRIQRRLQSEGSIDVTVTLDVLSSISLAMGRHETAERYARESVEILRKARGDASPRVAQALARVAAARAAAADYEESERLEREALGIVRAAFGNDHKSVASALGRLGAVLWRRGDYDGSEKAFREAIGILRARGNGDDLDLAGCLSGLGNTLAARDDAAAEGLVREAFEIRRRVSGDAHPAVAIHLCNLAKLALEKDDLAVAEQLDRRALEILRNVFGDEHPEVASARCSLATTLHRKGDHEGAERLFREALEIQTGLFGERHPAVATTLSNFSELLKNKGDKEGAERLMREALAIWRETLGVASIRAAEGLSNLGGFLVEEARYEEAALCLGAAVPIMRAKLGAENPYTLHRCMLLARALWENGDAAGMESLLREILPALRRTFGEDITVARAVSNLAMGRTRAGDYEAAEALFREALGLFRKVGHVDSIEVAVSLRGIGGALGGKGDPGAAVAPLRESLDIVRRLPRATDGDVAESLTELGRALARSGGSEEAEPLLREALAMWRALPDRRQELSYCLEGLAHVAHDRGRLDEAAAFFAEALEIQRAIPEGREVPTLLRNLARVLLDRGDIEGAERNARELATMRGSDDAFGAVMLAAVLAAKKDFAGAEPIYARALENARSTLGDAHPTTTGYRAYLAFVVLERGDAARAETICREGLDAARTDALLVLLGSALIAQGRHADAEPPLREALATREKTMPDHWLRYATMSVLGECLLGQGKLAEAEPLLVAAAERIDPPPISVDRKRKALERVVKLYEAMGKPEQAAQWRGRLE